MITRLITSAHQLNGVEDSSVNLIAESSPYYQLRHYAGEQETSWPQVVIPNPFGGEPLTTEAMTCALGWEARPRDFLAHLILCLREHRRVLRDDGVLFFNLMDRYQNKQALMLPQQLALLAQADGWLVRHASLPWLKLNGLPNENRDRFVTAHEDILMLTKSRDYFFNPDAIRRPQASYGRKGGRATYTGNGAVRHGRNTTTLHQMADERGRLCRTVDVWTESVEAMIDQLNDYSAYLRQIVASKQDAQVDDSGNIGGFLVNTQAYRGQHDAGWPERLVELLVRAGTSDAGCCSECGRVWRTEQDCSCVGATAVPCVVGDFFAGTGVTAKVAVRLRRRAIIADVSEYYMNDLSGDRLASIQVELF